jgi:Lon protease-like protein
LRAGPTSLGPFDPSFAELPQSLPIFPLTSALLLPGGRLPLNIFEPRYLAMTRHALMQPDRLIGMVQPQEPNADREMDPAVVPKLNKIGCAGRIAGFEETEDGRYLLSLSGLIRFRIKRELPITAAGFRQVEPDFSPFKTDMAERNFILGDRAHFMSTLKSYFAGQNATIDWKAVNETPDDRLVVSLGMLCPFTPQEKQSLLECADLDEMGAMLQALFEVTLRHQSDDHRPLH